MKILSLYSPKGGVGKSVNAVNISYVFSLEGKKTLLWDFDPQGASSFYLRVEQSLSKDIEELFTTTKSLEKNIKHTSFTNLHAIPSDFSLKSLDLVIDDMKRPIKKLRQTISEIKGYDFLVIDSPPGFTNINRLISKISDMILVPVIPTYLSLRTLEMLKDFLFYSGVDKDRIFPFFSMADKRKKLHRQIIDEMCQDFQIKSVIPYSAEIEKMGDALAPAPHFSKDKNITEIYYKFRDEILECLTKL